VEGVFDLAIRIIVRHLLRLVRVEVSILLGVLLVGDVGYFTLSSPD